MDKYTTIKIDEIQRLAEKKQYKEAILILNSIDTRKIKAIEDLSVFAEVFSKNECYEEAVDILLRIYAKSKTRRVLSQLIYITLKLKKFEIAEEYYDEYLELAPNDDNRFILRYRIEKAKGAPFAELIDILEELKEYNYIEEWAYELAKLYHKSGYQEKCIEECNEIILWFGEGTVVEKANKLKNYYAEIEKPNLEEGFVEEDTKKEDDEENENWNEIVVDYSGLGIRGIDKFLEPGEEAGEESEQIAGEESNERMEQKDSRELEEETPVEFDRGAEGQILICDVDMDSIFKNYMSIQSVKEQLEVIFRKCFLNKESKQNGFYVTGYGKSGRTRLALMIAKACYRLGRIPTSKAAVISSDKLNIMGDLSKKEKMLAGCCLVIERASELERGTVESLLNIMKKLEDQLIVILEDAKSPLESCFDHETEWKQNFPLGVHLPDYGKEDLIGFMKTHLKEEEYELEEDAEEILKNVAGSTARRVDPDRRLSVMVERVEKAKDFFEKRGGGENPKVIQADDFRIG